ncbi:MAG: ATP-dependent zinc metalloprotease FtsH [bacterium]
MQNIIKNFLIIFVTFLAISFVFSFYFNPQEQTKEISLSALVEQINNEQVKQIEISGNNLNVTLNDNTKEKAAKEPEESLSSTLKNYGVAPDKLVKLNIINKTESGWEFWLANLLPIVIPFLLIAGFIYFMMRQAQGANRRALMFGQSQAREVKPQDKKTQTTFKGVAGAKEAKEELYEIVEFLKDPKKFTSIGAKIPKGVLLLGPPGVGKTLLARAVAGEANVPFFHISGSEFVEMFVGVGAARARDLFQRAKKNAPSILFIDEIDAVGRRRGAGLGGSHDEREQTLNQILVEMDGFDPHTNVIVIAATNRPDVLDPALLRPGRFDRRIVLDLPDIADREAILKVHAQNKPLAPEVNLRRVAERTPGFSGADLENLLNEAAILTARRNKKQISQGEIFESIEKVLLGPERKSHILSKREKEIIAVHEAGHALVAHELPNADPVHKVSIISRGRAAGYTLKLPLEDKHFHTKAEFLDDLAVFLAGYAAEREIFKEITTGAANDLKQATQLAKRLVTDFGMSQNMPPRTFGEREELIFLGREITEQRDYSEKIAEQIDQEISQFINIALTTATSVIKKKKGKLLEIKNLLMEKETLEQEEFESIFKKKEKKVEVQINIK